MSQYALKPFKLTCVNPGLRKQRASTQVWDNRRLFVLVASHAARLISQSAAGSHILPGPIKVDLTPT